MLALAVPSGAAAATRPDLKVATLSAPPASLVTSALLSLSDTTVNAGKAGAGRSVTRYLLSADRRFSKGDPVLGQRTIRILRAGARSRGSVRLSLAAVSPGTYFVLACADARTKVRESNERNNCRASTRALLVTANTAMTPTPTPAPSPAPAPSPTPSPSPTAAKLLLGPEGVDLAPVPPAVNSADFTLKPGKETSHTFTATTLDEAGNPLKDVTAETAFSMSPNGTCADATCGGTQPGSRAVSGTYGSLQDEVLVTTSAYDVNYSMTCRGERYDVNGSMADGCEAAQARAGSTTAPGAFNLGSATDCDAFGGTVNSNLYSDTRTHTNPEVPGFESTVGSAPMWLRVTFSNDPFCTNDPAYSITTSGGTNTACYRLTVSWAGTPVAAQVSLTGQGSRSFTSGPVPDGAQVYFEFEKTCSTAVTESVAFTLTYHFYGRTGDGNRPR